MLYSYLVSITIIGSFIIFCGILSRLNTLPHLSSGDDVRKRYTHVDGIRGLAAVFVVCAHSWRVGLSGFSNQEILVPSFKYNVALGAIGVQIFFCITAFLFIKKLINNRNQDWSKYFWSRFKRLAPLYSFFVLVVLSIGLAMSSSIDERFIVNSIKLMTFGFLSDSYLLTGFDGSQLVTMVWTLPFEIKFYITLPLIAAIMSSRKASAVCFICLISLASFVFYIDGKNMWACFIAGGVAALIESKINKNNIIKYSSTIIFIMSIVSTAYLTTINTHNYSYIKIMSVSIMFISFIISEPSIFKCKSLQYMGEISYSIYLLHVIAFYAFAIIGGSYLNGIYVSGTQLLLIQSSLCLIICMGCSLTFRYIEYPFIRKS
ncbi:hypothetical protein CJP72_06205 [Citrobacter sp. NCU1]|uniref:acyltransferase family protein n=1 Tax=Citrobacter sp. NCU1 TaxID=2026683 RepID=UPI0013920721|nr:acyltransferase [Citrobacter sp. NCU1]NDO80383.1 hypothetical protein [Citrobacter sp. NCU1]